MGIFPIKRGYDAPKHNLPTYVIHPKTPISHQEAAPDGNIP